MLGFSRLSVACLLAAVLVGCSDSPGTGEPLPPVGTETGSLAPLLAGTLGTGEPFEVDAGAAAQTVLVFYRGAYCGLCREQLRALQAELASYEAVGARLLAVTPDALAAVAAAGQQLGLGFPIIAADSATLRRWGVVDETGAAVLPTAVILDERGVIRYRRTGRNAGDRASNAELLAALQQAPVIPAARPEQ